jgi:hypothetical protein
MGESLGESEARQAVVRQVVDLLASGDYLTLQTISRGVRLSASDLAHAVREYGAPLLPLPPEADSLVHYVRITNATPAAWSVVVPLFSREEGRSDLSLELTLSADGHGGFTLELDNLHVL